MKLKNNLNKTLYNKLIKMVMIIIVVMFIVLSFFITNYNHYKDLVIKTRKDNILNLVTTVSDQLEVYFNEKDQYIKEILNNPEFNEQFIDLLQNRTNNLPLIELLYRFQSNEILALEVINKDGYIIKTYTNNNEYAYKKGVDIQRAIDIKRDVYYIDTKGDRTINIVNLIKINGEIHGFIRMKISSEYIYDTYLDNYKLSKKGYISVKDRYGNLLLHPSNESIGENVMEIRRAQHPSYDWSELEQLVKRQLNKEEGTGIYHSIWPGEGKRIKKISGFTPCQIGDEFMIISFTADYNETISNLEGIKNLTMILTALLITMCISAIIYIYIIEVKKNKLLLETVYLNELREKNALLMHQSRFAAMGEMIATIAHQLKQPLNALKISLYNIEDYHVFMEDDKSYLDKLLEANHRLVNKMAKTIDDFNFFFKPQDEIKEFNIYNAIEFAIELNVTRLNNLEIDVSVYGDKDLKIKGESNIFSQVILNLLNNSIDALKDKEKARNIKIFIKEIKNKVIIELLDNGGGIKEEIFNRLFEPYVTTKGDSGSGLGLYISKNILKEKFNGSLNIENTKYGVKEEIIIPKGGLDEYRQ